MMNNPSKKKLAKFIAIAMTCLPLSIASSVISANTETKEEHRNHTLTSKNSGEDSMPSITQAQRDENLKQLIDENHDLTGLETKVNSYLASANTEKEEIDQKIKNLLGNNETEVLSELSSKSSNLADDMQNVFTTLKTDLLNIKGKKVAKGEEHPMIPVMLAYKKSLFAIKGNVDQIANDTASRAKADNAQLEALLRDKLLNQLKIKALSGLGELEETGVLHKILLKLTFSLASIDIKVPFTNWAPEHVVEQFWLYLEIQRRDSLKIPFVEFYKDPTPYVN